ncbi:MAG: sulfotransferase family 2 domain-containing protein [Cyanobacteria bacterium P01_A01_bin.135]
MSANRGELVDDLRYWLAPPYLLRSQLHILKARGEYQRARRENPEHLFRIFDQYRCLYIHIPKAGGVSIYNSLFAEAIGKEHVKSVGHYSIRDYQLIFGSKTVQDYFTFSIVRNPWARVLSAYKFLRRGGFHKWDAIWAEKHLSKFNSFDDFVIRWLTPHSACRAMHFIPQHNFLVSCSGQLKIDFIGKLETIEADFDAIRKTLNIDCRIRHLNRSKPTSDRRGYRRSYTAQSQRIVEQVYQKDIEVFGYEF